MTNIIVENKAVSWRLLLGVDAPVGAAYPFLQASKGSMYLRTGNTDDLSSMYFKVANDGDDNDWVLSYSQSLPLPTPVSRILPLPIATGGGTSDITTFNNAPSINLNADGETFYAQFWVPIDWNRASDLIIRLLVANEIAEDAGDDVSMTLTVNSYADGQTMGTNGQTVTVANNLADGTEAINKMNICTGTIDHDHGTYPILVDRVCTIKGVVNLADTGEATGPLHIVSWWIEYTSNTFY